MAQKGLSAWTTVCGIPVTCKPDVSLSLGPVVGEVTSTSAIIMLEVGNESSLPTEVTCHIHRKVGTGLVQEQMITFPDKAPKVFVFGEGSALEPNTEYIAVFSGICREDATQTFAMFKTKPEEIKSFKIIALSCDRPDRMLLGQKNPWHELAGKSYEADVMLHLGDQIYNKGEDTNNTQLLLMASRPIQLPSSSVVWRRTDSTNGFSGTQTVPTCLLKTSTSRSSTATSMDQWASF